MSQAKFFLNANRDIVGSPMFMKLLRMRAECVHGRWVFADESYLLV